MDQGHRVCSIPGNSRKIITVGSSDDFMKILGNRRLPSYYSGRGPTASCIMKPDVVAPGTNIYSCGLHHRYAIQKRNFHGHSRRLRHNGSAAGTISLLHKQRCKKKLKFNCDHLNTPTFSSRMGQDQRRKIIGSSFIITKKPVSESFETDTVFLYIIFFLIIGNHKAPGC